MSGLRAATCEEQEQTAATADRGGGRERHQRRRPRGPGGAPVGRPRPLGRCVRRRCRWRDAHRFSTLDVVVLGNVLECGAAIRRTRSLPAPAGPLVVGRRGHLEPGKVPQMARERARDLVLRIRCGVVVGGAAVWCGGAQFGGAGCSSSSANFSCAPVEYSRQRVGSQISIRSIDADDHDVALRARRTRAARPGCRSGPACPATPRRRRRRGCGRSHARRARVIGVAWARSGLPMKTSVGHTTRQFSCPCVTTSPSASRP